VYYCSPNLFAWQVTQDMQLYRIDQNLICVNEIRHGVMRSFTIDDTHSVGPAHGVS
jgi:hypothetical protein